ncbi:MAG: TIGR02757 family protein [Synergistes sp.]|nr:TIGR02757 family protein [Synergistes sp.]
MRPLEERAARIQSRAIFEKIYCDYNKRCYVSPDPLQFLYDYDNVCDREIAGLITSALAYGRVAQILKSCQRVLAALGAHPAEYLKKAERDDYACKLKGFVHRFTKENEMSAFLYGLSRSIREYGTMENLFMEGWHGNMREAMEHFSASVNNFAGCENSFLLPRPSKGSACKRLALFLRWVVRHDDVDPGGWNKISPADLIIPLDTHIFNITSTLGLCSSKSANGKAADAITANFRDISPDDPVKYDFALTRYGIREEMSVEDLFAKWQNERLTKTLN